MKKFSKIFKYIIPFKKEAILTIVFNIFSAIFGMLSVAAISPFLGVIFGTNTEADAPVPVDDGFGIKQMLSFIEAHLQSIIEDKGQMTAIIFISAIMVFMTLLKTSTMYLMNHFLAPIRAGIVRNIRNDLFSKILALPLSYYSEERKGDIMSRISSDVQEVQASIISSISAYINNPFIIIANLFLLISISPKLTLFVFIILPLSGFFIGKLGKSLKNPSMKGQIKLGELLAIIEETITGLRIIKAFNNQNQTNGRFRDINHIFSKLQVKINRKRALAGPLSEFLGTITIVTILIYGSGLVFAGKSDGLQAETLIMYIAAFYLIINPAKAFSTAYYNIQKGLASSERINKILNAQETIHDEPNAKSINGFETAIEYKNVHFSYNTEEVLKGVSFKLEKGKTLAIVGHSGSGKSTLADLLPRLIDANSGDILIDGMPIKSLKIKSLRQIMSIVTQQSILFNDSIYNNIAFGDENATLEKVMEAAKVANAHEFISQIPEGYESGVGDAGGKLSGGQKQRITIARAIYKNPPILILDEATSALDTESERLVQDALTNLMKNRTSIVIAHRLSTIKHADEILVMKEGLIVERGKHKDLLEKDGEYRKLHDMQMFS